MNSRVINGSMSTDPHPYDAVLTKPCLICGKENRFHRVFWSPRGLCYIRQTIDDEWLDEGVGPLVPSSDHYACIDNLEYLEWKLEQR